MSPRCRHCKMMKLCASMLRSLTAMIVSVCANAQADVLAAGYCLKRVKHCENNKSGCWVRATKQRLWFPRAT